MDKRDDASDYVEKKMEWDEYFIKMCKLVGSKSKDRSVKIGAVIVGLDNEVVSTGFNGFSRGVKDDVEERHERPLKYKWAEHAERNAVYNAARIGSRLKGCTIYVDWIPCCDCARAIIQSGIFRVIIDGEDFENKYNFWKERWEEDMKVTNEMFNEAGISILMFQDGWLKRVVLP